MQEPGARRPPVESDAGGGAQRDPGQVALGEILRDRGRDVAESVVQGLWGERPPTGLIGNLIVEKLLDDAAWSVTRLGSWLVTGQLPSPAQRRDLASHGRGLADGYISMIDMTRSYLLWRDAILRIVDEEGARLALAPETVEAVRATVRHSCDAVLMGTVKAYEAGRQDLQRQLDAEHDKLRHLALHDPLTGLGNRALLVDRLGHALERAARRPETVAVLFLDLDGFKEINDRYGHHVGDQVLIEIGARLLVLVRSSDTVSRLGGDEFVILCEQVEGGEAELARLAARVRDAVACPLDTCPGQHVSVSVGTVVAAPGFDTDAVLRAADAAMYGAKHAAAAALAPR